MRDASRQENQNIDMIPTTYIKIFKEAAGMYKTRNTRNISKVTNRDREALIENTDKIKRWKEYMQEFKTHKATGMDGVLGNILKMIEEQAPKSFRSCCQ